MIVGICLAFAVYLAILWVVARSALYPPRSPIFLSPAAVGAPTEEVEFQSGSLSLRGWWVPFHSPRAVFVMLHGYVMNRAENAWLAAELHKRGFACLLFDSRASGKSDGRKVGIGWPERLDAIAACKEAERRYPGVPRILIGSSMGAAAAGLAVGEDPTCASAVILDSAYHTLPTATLGWWRFLGGTPAAVMLAPVVVVAWPMAGFNPFRVNVGESLKKANLPTLILHGRLDSLVNPVHAVRNRNAAGHAEIEWFEDAGHSEARWTHPEEFVSRVLRFVERVPGLGD